MSIFCICFGRGGGVSPELPLNIKINEEINVKCRSEVL